MYPYNSENANECKRTRYTVFRHKMDACNFIASQLVFNVVSSLWDHFYHPVFFWLCHSIIFFGLCLIFFVPGSLLYTWLEILNSLKIRAQVLRLLNKLCKCKLDYRFIYTSFMLWISFLFPIVFKIVVSVNVRTYIYMNTINVDCSKFKNGVISCSIKLLTHFSNCYNIQFHK